MLLLFRLTYCISLNKKLYILLLNLSSKVRQITFGGIFMYMRITDRRNRKYGDATKRKVIELYEQGYGCVIIS